MEFTYPLSPGEVPKNLTRLSAAYKIKASLAVLSVLLFFALYFALVTGFAWLMYYALIYDMVYINKATILLKIGAIAGAVMLFVFSLKFIFKLKNPKYPNRLQLDRKDHPQLFAFVEKICAETGAPKPRRIFADPDVNAYVSYSNIWLSLFLPVRKDLTIGLGLVDGLNLTEFKAVVSHEFGHFSQRSMKIGSYIVSANTIIHDMIFTRDKWDETLATWRSADLRLSFAAWIVTPVIWLLRQILRLFYIFLNMMYSSLSREMEFNADKVAVSTSGSEAIVSSLWKLEFGNKTWDGTMNNVYLAAQKKMYTANIYRHNGAALEKASDQQQKLVAAFPVHEKGGKKYFQGSENSRLNMYASHPPNNQREENAKTPFIAAENDIRSPWILFGETTALQEKMTHLLYTQYLNVKPENFVSDEVFDDFIKTEAFGKELMAEYENTFENRFILIPENNDINLTDEWTMGPFDEKIVKLKAELHTLMEPVLELEAQMQVMRQVAAGTYKDKKYVLRGKTYNRKNINEAYGILFEEREKHFSGSFKNWDSAFCRLNLTMAREKGRAEKLRALYVQHRTLSNIYKLVIHNKNQIFNRLAGLQQRNDVSALEVSNFSIDIMDCLKRINQEIEKLNEIEFVALPNIESLEEFKHAIINKGRFTVYKGNIFDSNEFGKVATELENAIHHCQRLDQKSIGYILSLQAEMKK